MCHFWTQNGPICPNKKKFSEKKPLLINLAPIIHAYLHSKNQSQTSIYKETLTIKDTETFPALLSEPDFPPGMQFSQNVKGP